MSSEWSWRESCQYHGNLTPLDAVTLSHICRCVSSTFGLCSRFYGFHQYFQLPLSHPSFCFPSHRILVMLYPFPLRPSGALPLLEAIAPASLSRPNQASLGKKAGAYLPFQRAVSPNINIFDHSSTTNINFVPTTSKQLAHLPNNIHPTWLEARENHLAASRLEARSEPMAERSNRATRARLVSRLVLREAEIHLLEVFLGSFGAFRGLHQCWRVLEGHPAESRHTDKQERDGWEA